MAKINACLEVEYKGISVVLLMLKLYLIVINLKY